jgi:predicted amidohydrolase YtcJ
MYAARLGAERATRMNPFASLAAAGVPLAFGSDSPVTPFAPWEGVRAAVSHTRADQRISPETAFEAHTRGGWRAARRTGEGVLAVGAPATLAVWAVDEPPVQGPDDGEQRSRTRAGTSRLPNLEPGAPAPRCLRTVVRGRVVHDVLD